MISRLRLRFFLITWPLVVVAVAAVALSLHRWTVTELDRVEVGPSPAVESAYEAAGALARRWAAAGSVALTPADSAAWSQIAAGDSVALVLVDRAGRLVYSTDPGVQLDRPPGGDGDADAATAGFRRAFETGSGQRVVEATEIGGRRVAGEDGTTVGYLYVLPGPDAPPAETMATTLAADARRTIWRAFLVAGLAAAAVALLLAGPLVRQIRRLAGAAARIEEGDLSARVERSSADELGQLEASFNRMAAALERAEAQKRTLVSDVAHELRTPLTNVVGLVEAVRDGMKEPDPDTLDALAAETGLLSGLVDDLQELSLAESGQLRYEIATVDATDQARQVVTAHGHGATDIDLQGPPADAEPIPVRADPRRLAQVLRNLVRNAITHSPTGGSVRVEVDRIGDEVRFQVSDTGPGIPAEHLPLVWERFHRVDPARSRDSGGRGLGLAIVRELVTGMGGRVDVESVEGEGSTFEVWLPAG